MPGELDIDLHPLSDLSRCSLVIAGCSAAGGVKGDRDLLGCRLAHPDGLGDLSEVLVWPVSPEVLANVLRELGAAIEVRR